MSETSAPRVQIVIVNFGTPERSLACLDSVAAEHAAGVDLSATLVDNGSTDGSGERLAAEARARGWTWLQFVHRAANQGLGAATNDGVQPALQSSAPPDYFFLLHPDTQLRPGALRALLDFMGNHPAAGLAGPCFEDERGEQLPSAFRFPSLTSEMLEGFSVGPLSRWLSRYEVAPPPTRDLGEAEWLSGAALLIRRQVFEDVGPWDERYFLHYGEVDFCMRAHLVGWTRWFVPEARVCHEPTEQAERPDGGQPHHIYEARRLFFEKTYGSNTATGADLMRLATTLAMHLPDRLRGRHEQTGRLLGELTRFNLSRWFR